jgi:ankyrin repeat protein
MNLLKKWGVGLFLAISLYGMESIYTSPLNHRLPELTHENGWFHVRTLPGSKAQEILNHQDKFGRTLLHYAALENKTQYAQSLIEQGQANLNIKDLEGNTPLHIAVQCNNYAMVDFLCKKGAHLDIKNKKQLTPFHISILKKHLNILELLGYYGADITIKMPAKVRGNQSSH